MAILANKAHPRVLRKGAPAGRHLGERMYDIWERIQIRLFSVFVRRQFGCCGRKVTVEPPFKFKNLQLVSVEDDVMIRHYGWIHAINHREEPSSPKIVIKAHTSIGMGVTISAVRRIVLEAHVLLARNVYISDHGHGFEDINTPIMFQGVRAIGEVSIGEHTWIGQNACVMPGVQIGRHCVIGANSVVTRDLPDYCVAVGSPARIIKQYNEKSKRWEKVSGRTQSVE